MKAIKILLLFIIIGQFVIAQREADVFIHGRCRPAFNCAGLEGNILFQFDVDTLVSVTQGITMNLATGQGRAAFADKNSGELLFASNGWRLINGSGQVLTHKLWRNDMPWPQDSFDSTMTLTNMGPLFLNHPGDSTKAYLFYGQYLTFTQDILPISKADRYFTYAILDIPSQNLISKNNIILNEWSGDGDMQACRHANGRDWWIIKPGVYEDELYIGLLDPQGINMQKITIPEMPHEGQLETFSFFSMDGNKYLHFSHKPNKRLHVFDFDRCSGSLIYQSGHDLVDSLRAIDYNGCNISPDGSKFYVRRSNNFEGTIIGGTCQYDISTGIFKRLANVMSGGNPMLSPNGKHIYYFNSENTGTELLMYLSFIQNPNLPADSLIFIENILQFSNNPTPVAPSCFANFRLGKIEGSACDTIVSSINQVNQKEVNVQLYPNPTKDVLYLEFPYPIGKPYQISIIDAMGKLVYSNIFAAEGGSLSLASLNLSGGLYVLHAQRDGKGYSRRFLIEN